MLVQRQVDEQGEKEGADGGTRDDLNSASAVCPNRHSYEDIRLLGVDAIGATTNLREQRMQVK